MVNLNNKQMAGFSLLEVLVAVVIMAIGLLGIAGIQLTGLRYTHNATLIYQATLQANDMVDRMRANLAGTEAGAYDGAIGIGSDPGCSLVNCTPGQMALTDIFEWNSKNAAVLPEGQGLIVANADSTYTVILNWQERSSMTTEQGFEDMTYSLTFRP